MSHKWLAELPLVHHICMYVCIGIKSNVVKFLHFSVPRPPSLKCICRLASLTFQRINEISTLSHNKWKEAKFYLIEEKKKKVKETKRVRKESLIGINHLNRKCEFRDPWTTSWLTKEKEAMGIRVECNVQEYRQENMEILKTTRVSSANMGK